MCRSQLGRSPHSKRFHSFVVGRTIPQDMPQSKVSIVRDLVMWDICAQVIVQEAGTLQDALIFSNKFSSVLFQRLHKGSVKVDPGDAGTKAVTATVIKVLLVLQFAVP